MQQPFIFFFYDSNKGSLVFKIKFMWDTNNILFM